MDVATQVKNAAALTRKMFLDDGGTDRQILGPPLTAASLREILEDIADRVFQLAVVADESYINTNIAGALEGDYIHLRPDLSPGDANFVIAHEIGHRALHHPPRIIQFDTDHDINQNVAADDLSAARAQAAIGIDLPSDGALALCGYNERDGYELQANAFAVELLAPGDLICRALETTPTLHPADIAASLGIPVELARVGMKQALSVHVTVASDAPPSEPLQTATANVLDSQQQIAVACSTPALVVAGPGAGKTRVLTRRFAKRVAEGVEPRNILALTFSNKAAAEMRERIATEIGADLAGQIEIYTFHSFGLHLLQQYGDRLGLPTPVRLITPTDAFLLFRRRAAKMSLGILSDLPKAQDTLKEILGNISRSKEENAGPERWQQLFDEWEAAHPGEPTPEWAGDNIVFFREYQATLRRYGLLDYGDLQTEALRLFDIPEVAEEIRSRYTEILVDEMQDINFVSGLLVRALDGPPETGRGVVWAVGDPRQSIYGFRGASPINLSRFRATAYYPNASIVPLTNNYRSYPDIVTAGAAVPMPEFSDPDLLPPGLTAIQRQPASQNNVPYVISGQWPHGDDESRWIAREIARLHKDDHVKLSDIAILARKNDQAAQIALALTAEGVTHRWGGPIEERAVFKVLMSALYLAADDPKGIVGLTSLSPGCNMPPEESLSESDRRALFTGRRGHFGARALLKEAAEGSVPGLSENGIEACRRLHTIAMALTRTYRPHQNLIVYLFEHCRWLPLMYPAEAKARPEVRAALITVLQTLDLAANFAAQRDALSRGKRSNRSQQNESIQNADMKSHLEDIGVLAEAPSDDQNMSDLETTVTTEAFLDYVTSVIKRDGFGASKEVDIGDAVTIMTAHKSKGLEWPVVFLPFCVDTQSNNNWGKSIPLPPGVIHTDEDEQTAQDRDDACLFYVSVTRARERLYLTSAAKYKKRGKGGISVLRQKSEEPLRQIGRIEVIEILPTAGSERPIGDDTAEAVDSIGDWLPYVLPKPIHEREIAGYLECPQKFQFSRIYGLYDTDIAYVQFSRAVYKALVPAGENDDRTLQDRFEQIWKESGPSDKHWQYPLLRDAADAIIARYSGDAKSLENRRFRENRTLTLADGSGVQHEILFSVDELIVQDNGVTRYLRHKSSAKTPNSSKGNDDDPRPLLYAIHAEQEGIKAEVGFYYPMPDAGASANVSAQRRKNFLIKWSATIDAIKQGKMLPTPGRHCKRCEFALICESAE